MSVYKVDKDSLFFMCPVCKSKREIGFGDVVVCVGSEWNYIELPQCDCMSNSYVVPDAVRTGIRNDIRRVAWKRAVASGNFKDKVSRESASDRTKGFDAFYNAEGREDLKALYMDDSSTVEILKKESK